MKRVPSYRKHKSGQARVTLDGVDHYLGEYGSPESHERYQRIIAEYVAGQEQRIRSPEVTVDIVLAHWLKAHHDTYRDDGPKWSRIKTVCRSIRDLYGTAIVGEFDGRCLKTLRAGWLRVNGLREVNRKSRIVQAIWRWAASERLVPADLAASVQAVASLTEREARAIAGEDCAPRRVHPVEPGVVEATLPHLNPVLADVVRLQILTGCRPGEALRLRMSEVERRSPDCWIYRPTQHKTAKRGVVRQILLGPKAMELVSRYLPADGDQYLFTSGKRAGQPYRRDSYTLAIRHAAKKAGQPHWHPHQLRHLAATAFAAQHGIELARIWLGHQTISTTLVYAQSDLSRIIGLIQDR